MSSAQTLFAVGILLVAGSRDDTGECGSHLSRCVSKTRWEDWQVTRPSHGRGQRAMGEHWTGAAKDTQMRRGGEGAPTGAVRLSLGLDGLIYKLSYATH